MGGRSGAWGWTTALAVALAGCAAAATPDEPAQLEDALNLTDEDLHRAIVGRIRPLSTVAVPAPVGGAIIDRPAAERLGKALFWDQQAGSDGQTACASCHFVGGADNRRTNTVSPGPNGLWETAGVTAAGQEAAAENVATDDRFGSQGVASARFVSLSEDPDDPADVCEATPSPVYGAHRQVTERNTPTVIGAVFFRELFWDGRASSVFNGHDPFGDGPNATLAAGAPAVRVENAALASQATGPVADPVEMACAGRKLEGPSSLGAKLLDRRALGHQTVHPTDSVLGSLSAFPEPGLRCGDRPCTYRDLIAAAFGPAAAKDAERRFARIWGEAIQAYEATLVPDDTPLDRFLSGESAALTDRQKFGLLLFVIRGRCIHCHFGPELSDASRSFARERGLVNLDGGDQGFHHIGVRPTTAEESEDLGRAGVGPNGASFSVSGAAADRGAFKTPMLRNVKLTAPYFHNGAKATLRDVVDFYDRGGDFPATASQLMPLSLRPGDADALVDLLENGFTDCRVEKEQGPFDHPSLDVPNGPRLPAVGAAGTGPCP